MFFRLRYSPFLAQMVVIRRCNLSCGYCSEYDKVSEPVPVEILEERLRKLKAAWNVWDFSYGRRTHNASGPSPHHSDLPRASLLSHEHDLERILLQPELIQTLNKAGLQRMQLSIDGVKANETTQKVLNNLKKRLQWLRDHARFEVVISAVIGACPPEEADEVVSFVRQLGFGARVLLVHDSQGQLKLSSEDLKAFENIVDKLPRRWPEFSGYRRDLVRGRPAPFKCRSGSRYLYIDEYGNVNWCSQTRNVWSKPLLDYTLNDLREQFYNYKTCNATCTLNCSRSASLFDNWRRQPAVTAS